MRGSKTPIYDVVHVSTVHQWNDPRILSKECQSLAKAGYKVGLIITDPQKDSMYGVDLIGLKRRRNRWFRMSLGVFEAFRKVHRSGASIVHFHDPELIPLGLIARLLGYQVIFDVHEDYVTSIKTVSRTIPRGLRGFFSAVYQLTIPVQKMAFNIIIAEEYYAETYPDATPVRNFPDLSLFFDYQTKERSAPGTVRLIYSGNVTLARGACHHETLVNALPGASLTMVGRCHADLVEGLQSNPQVSLPSDGSFVPFEDIVESYDKDWTAGLAIFPETDHYTRKALTKLYEYAAAGIPVVCSDFPVWKKLVEENGLGLCVPPDDVEAQKKAVLKLSKDKVLYEKFSRLGRQFAHETASWTNEAQTLIELYNQLESRSHASPERLRP